MADNMATKEVTKLDPNTEAFQMRAQWKKAEICRQQWHQNWGWLLEEREQTLKEVEALRREAATAMPRVVMKQKLDKSLKPVPCTSTGFVGWLATRPDCQLEIYTSWLTKIPVKAPDAWELKSYHAYQDK